ncbi:MAG: ATP-dependent DNA helicase RecG [Ruminiclostridium sp.]|nr:ATP-dependent DNA helicase RecG [Ruminiclostridium sp.]
MHESDGISKLRGVGPKRVQLFENMGIRTVGDLLRYFPRDYTDYTKPAPISSLMPDETAVFAGKITRKLHPYITPKYSLYKVVVNDGTDDILITFFNSQFVFEKLTEGGEYVFSGKIKGSPFAKECSSPGFIQAGDPNVLVPKYHLTAGITANVVSLAIKDALAQCAVSEPLSEEIREKHGLVGYKKALSDVHFPVSHESLETARHRLAFEELLTLQLGLRLMKNSTKKAASVVMSDTDMSGFFGSLRFTPTGAQLRSVEECIADMKSGVPMNRLLQGDVGSGKTLVAAALCFFAARNGCQSALMAPTEILAKQHANTLADFLEPHGITVALLTGSTVKKPVYAAIESGQAAVVVGTHALIQSAVQFRRLGLVITDEQHRFGVRQRTVLSSKGESPHTLVMSATPIPRTLAFAVYGDLDVSVLDEMPKGRVPIRTYGVDSSYRERIFRFIIKYIKNGFQAYIVCPFVEKSDSMSDKASAEDYFAALKQTWFSDIPIGLLHGKMKQTEKDRTMAAFKDGTIKLLVATTVIEVGIDVPNAVIIVVENAEQFGLSQLHQLRGRVGRGSEQSHCILITDSRSEYTKARIDTMVRTSDGFEIANEDLKLRGPGNFFGAAQHGLPTLKIADLNADVMLLHETERLAEDILAGDPKLSSAENSGLRRLVEGLFRERETFGVN